MVHHHRQRGHGYHHQYGHRSLTPHASVSDFALPEEMRDSLYCDPNEGGSSIPIFTHDGNINADVKGVSRLQFQRLTWYYTLVSLSWRVMILLSCAFYLVVVACFSVAYYVMCYLCGAHTSAIGALYFVVVSISANGGYMGEDVDVMYPGHRCFAQRTYLVLAATYAGILLAALIATVFIAKASMHSKLQHRVVFSDYVTLNMISTETFRMSFRVANISYRPMVHGKLRLYLVSMRPGAKARNRKGVSRAAAAAAAARPTYLSVASQGPPPPQRKKDPRGTATAAKHRGSGNAVAADGEGGGITLTVPSEAVQYAPRTSDLLHSQESLSEMAADSEAAKLLGAALERRGGAADYGSVAGDAAAHHLPRHHSEDSLRLSPSTDGGGVDVGPAEDDDDAKDEGVPLHMCIEELPWSCDEEVPLSGSEGNLNLWFPVTIHHVIDRDSPLYYALTKQARPAAGGLYHRGHRHFFHQRQDPLSPGHHSEPLYDDVDAARHRTNHHGGASTHRGGGGPPSSVGGGDAPAAPVPTGFQVVAVFEATDAATSTVIESKHVYTPDNLIAHYHFAYETILTQPLASEGDGGEGGDGAWAHGHQQQVNLHGIAVSGQPSTIDYFRFNELAPDDDDDDE